MAEARRPFFAIYGASAFFPVAGKDPRGPGGRVSVPCPLDPGTPNEPWWVDRHAARASHYRSVGFSHLMWPPLAKTQSGASPTGTGYGVFDPYDLGSKDQQNSIPTRFGDVDRVQRAVAILRRNGIGSLADMVLHQRAGGAAGVYEFKGPVTEQFPKGVPKTGRWPLSPSCIRGGVDGKLIPPFSPPDDVPSPPDDFPFGDECCYQRSTPAEYMAHEAMRWGQWYIRRLQLDGVRIDDCKGVNAAFIGKLLAMLGVWATGEYFDGNPQTLRWYVWNQLGGALSVLDFSTHWALKGVLDYGGSMWALDPGRLWSGQDGTHAVTFVDTPDTDLSPGQQIINSKRLAYAYICLIAQGVPWIYHRDYSSDTGCYGLGDWIDNMLWCRRNLLGGQRVVRHIDHDVIAVETLGHQVGQPGSLAALSIDPWNHVQISCQTSWGPYRHLQDYTGSIPDVWTDRNGVATFKVPSNYFGGGNSYVCLGPAGVQEQPLNDLLTTTQVFEGSALEDLDIGPASNRQFQVARIWCERGRDVTLECQLADAVPTGGQLAITLHNDADGSIGQMVMPAGVAMTTLSGKAESDGWQDVTFEGAGLPTDGLSFTLAATYTATEGLS